MVCRWLLCEVRALVTEGRWSVGLGLADLLCYGVRVISATLEDGFEAGFGAEPVPFGVHGEEDEVDVVSFGGTLQSKVSATCAGSWRERPACISAMAYGGEKSLLETESRAL